jgi:hypothetical protein
MKWGGGVRNPPPFHFQPLLTSVALPNALHRAVITLDGDRAASTADFTLAKFSAFPIRLPVAVTIARLANAHANAGDADFYALGHRWRRGERCNSGSSSCQDNPFSHWVLHLVQVSLNAPDNQTVPQMFAADTMRIGLLLLYRHTVRAGARDKALQGLQFRGLFAPSYAATKLLESGLDFLTSLYVRGKALRVAERIGASAC